MRDYLLQRAEKKELSLDIMKTKEMRKVDKIRWKRMLEQKRNPGNETIDPVK